MPVVILRCRTPEQGERTAAPISMMHKILDCSHPKPLQHSRVCHSAIAEYVEQFHRFVDHVLCSELLS